MDILIPKEEQLLSLSMGIIAFYQKIMEYTKAEIVGDFRKYLTVTKEELIHFLIENPQNIDRHLSDDLSISKMHDLPVILKRNNKWIVGWTNHGVLVNVESYNDRYEATAEFLLAYW